MIKRLIGKSEKLSVMLWREKFSWKKQNIYWNQIKLFNFSIERKVKKSESFPSLLVKKDWNFEYIFVKTKNLEAKKI